MITQVVPHTVTQKLNNLQHREVWKSTWKSTLGILHNWTGAWSSSVIILRQEVGVKYYKNLSTVLWKLRTLVCSEQKLQKDRAKKDRRRKQVYRFISHMKFNTSHEETLCFQFSWQGTMIRDNHLTDVTTLPSMWRYTTCTQANWCLAKTLIQSKQNTVPFIN